MAFQSSREGELAIFWRVADGAAAPERLTTPEKDTSHTPTSISPDGSTLLYEAIKTAEDRTAWSFSLKDRRASMLQEVQASNVISPTFAPNGRWIAVSSNRGLHGTSHDRAPRERPLRSGRFEIVLNRVVECIEQVQAAQPLHFIDTLNEGGGWSLNGFRELGMTKANIENSPSLSRPRTTLKKSVGTATCPWPIA